MGFHFRGWFGAWMARVRSSTVSCGSPAAMFLWGKEGADGSESFRRAMGFHFRGWFGAWMAGVGSSTVRPASGGAMEVRRWFTGDSVERESSCVGLGASLL